MAAEENDQDGINRQGSLAARKIRRRPRHGTELGSSQSQPREGSFSGPVTDRGFESGLSGSYLTGSHK